MPRCELDLLLREVREGIGATFEDAAPPSSVVLPLVTRRPREERARLTASEARDPTVR
jgi:hypothetical protein